MKGINSPTQLNLQLIFIPKNINFKHELICIDITEARNNFQLMQCISDLPIHGIRPYL